MPTEMRPLHPLHPRFKNLLDQDFCAIKKGSSHQRKEQPNYRRKAVMKRLLVLLVAATLSAQAAQIRFALSPPGTDAGVGLSPSNEVPVVTNSTGSGNIAGTSAIRDYGHLITGTQTHTGVGAGG